MAYIYIIIGVIIAYFQVAYSPQFTGIRSVSSANVSYIVEGMTIAISDAKIRLFVQGFKVPKKRVNINCNVSREYLGPDKKGHFRL